MRSLLIIFGASVFLLAQSQTDMQTTVLQASSAQQAALAAAAQKTAAAKSAESVAHKATRDAEDAEAKVQADIKAAYGEATGQWVKADGTNGVGGTRTFTHVEIHGTALLITSGTESCVGHLIEMKENPRDDNSKKVVRCAHHQPR